ncbi:MAG: DUF805 domain-containing protein [Rhizobiales bacterium]|nr:DUF805 domain-containing protein [Hyphomicrobiales bacterium]
MNMQESVSSVLSQYATFSGRAMRSEFWWWVLFVILLSIATNLVDGIALSPLLGYSMFGGPQILSGLVSLALLIPGIAVSVRRLHDVGRSGWWLLLCLVPLVGALVLLFWYVQPGEPGRNRFG